MAPLPHPWFPPEPPVRPAASGLGHLVRFLVGAAIGTTALLASWITLGIVALSLSGLTGLLSLTASGRSRLDRFWSRLAAFVGRFFSVLFLAPLFLVGFTLARGFMRLLGRDSLRLREKGAVTYWLPADAPERKDRHIARLFATERIVHRSGGWAALLLTLLLLLLAGEGLLRLFGFGHPVLYRHDAMAGFRPEPHFETGLLTHYKGGLKLNSWGMRAPEFNETRNPNDFRILMLGDSTLWGGHYVATENLYARRLHANLNRLAEEKGMSGRVEILNLGVNAWGPFHELGFVRKYGTLGADVVIICLPYGDVYRGLTQLDEVPFWPRSRPPLLALEEVANHLAWYYRERIFYDERMESAAEHTRLGRAAYVDLATLLRRKGIEVRFEILPSREAESDAEIPRDEAEQVDLLVRDLEAAGAPVHYRQGIFRQGGDSTRYFEDSCHLNEAGHAVYADDLTARLPHQSPRLKAWLQGETR